MLDEGARAYFQTFGFAVLRQVFDPAPLHRELEQALDAAHARAVDTGVARVQYVPMAGPHTPHSVALSRALEPVAEKLLGGPVLPVRAKGMRYSGATRWHADADGRIESIGLAAYLDRLDAETGALRVLPSSHRPEAHQRVAAYLAQVAPASVDALPGVAVATSPGDVLVFDEHLFHASAGGLERLQWRMDFVPEALDEAGETALREFFAQLLPASPALPYDPRQFPSYAPEWLASDARAAVRLRRLGVEGLLRAHEGTAGADASLMTGHKCSTP